MRPYLLLAALAACAPSVHPDFEAARTAALADPGPPPTNWQPDVVARLSNTTIQQAIRAVLDQNGSFKTRFSAGMFAAEPELKIAQLNLSPSRRCAGCVLASASLTGKLTVTGFGTNMSVGLGADTDLDVEFSSQNDGDTFSLWLRPEHLGKVNLNLGAINANIAALVSNPLQRWLMDTAMISLPKIRLATFGSNELPLRAFRVEPSQQGLVIGLLTRAPSNALIGPIDAPPPSAGFDVWVRPETVIAIARAEVFKRGLLDMDLLVEPTHLELANQTFDLDLRIWRMTGKGWWRDYDVDGRVNVNNGAIQLNADEAQVVETSKGAGWVDPLAALGSGIILDLMEKTMTTAIPAGQTAQVGATRTEIGLVGMTQVGQNLKLTGSFAVR